MKRKELKKTFEDIVKDVKISNKLKEKTLNKIYSENNVYPFPYWLKNCTATFIVTCLCLSIYLVNNKSLFNSTKISDDISSQEQKTTNELVNLQTPSQKLKSLSIENYSVSYGTYSEDNLRTESLLKEKNSNITMDINININEQYLENFIGLTEDEFIRINPEAQKTEDGYIIIKNNQKILYKVKDNIIFERLIN